jgi:hypothetical protein
MVAGEIVGRRVSIRQVARLPWGVRGSDPVPSAEAGAGRGGGRPLAEADGARRLPRGGWG